MNGSQNIALENLLTAWIRHDDARQARNFRQLADAHFDLDGARHEMRSTFAVGR